MSASARAGLLLASLALSGACATQPATTSGFLGDVATLQPVEGTLRAQILQRRDAAVAAGAETVAILPSRIAADADIAAGIDPASFALVTGELDRQLCFALSRRYTLVAPDAQPGLKVEAVVTRLQETNAAASVASAALSRALPGPGSVRLPVGRGGLSVEARAATPQGQEAAAVSWSRGAGVAMDRGSLSEVGDAHRFAADFADHFATHLASDQQPEQAVPTPDPCARFGSRLDIAGRAASIGLGLHVPRDVDAPAPASGTSAVAPSTRE